MENQTPIPKYRPLNPLPGQETTKASSNQPKKKHHGFRNFLIVLIVIVAVLAIGATATGLYEVPVLSSIVGAKPKNLGIKTSPEALASLKTKIPLTISGPAVDYSGSSDKIFSGQMPVDTNRTSEEITSWINRFQGPNPPVKDVQVKFIEGGMEISGMIAQYIKAPIYIKVGVTQNSSNSVTLNIQKAKIGLFNVPEKYLKQAQDSFQDKINERLGDIPGYAIERLEYHDGYSYFKGTYPKNVAPNSKGWSALLD
ncbi:MAG: hypothetical protein WCT08_05215 [Patescibacteria group bacterium]|jgi:hypothetical protein